MIELRISVDQEHFWELFFKLCSTEGVQLGPRVSTSVQRSEEPCAACGAHHHNTTCREAMG